jgi:serine/threonine protein kinase
MVSGAPALRGDVFGLVGTIFNERFAIERVVAEGGFALVYQARQVALDRRVALKILKTPVGYDEPARVEFREKFASEAKTIARLKHPHIVDVYDFAVSPLPSGELMPWMALEWIAGESLAARLERRRGEGARGMDPAEAVELLRPVLQALAFAHRQGVVHRDIKPGNVLVAETEHGPTLKVLDFGIAKIVLDDRSPATGHTRTDGVPTFSPAYAAPEQVAYSRTGPWTDVHALGLVLTELMTDEPPFADPDSHVFEQVMAARRPTPGSKGRDVGPYEEILKAALALSPRDRWKNAGELLVALDEARSGRRPSATPATPASGPVSMPVSAPVLAAVSGPVSVAAGPRSRATFARGLLALASVIALAMGVWAWRSRKVEVRAATPPPVSTATPAPTPMPPSVVVAPPPEPPPPVASVPGAAPADGVRAAKGVETPQTMRRKRKNVALPPTRPDGRDLFDDTK